MPTVQGNLVCGSAPASYALIEIKSLISNRAAEEVMTTLSLDSEQASLILDT